ncbi:hypothetical protein KAH55_04240 [bacterium]|nr:hypothetical protein [bacterium]
MKGNIVNVKGIKMPEPQAKPALPKALQGFFPFCGNDAPLVVPMSAGSYTKKNRYTYTRAMRELGYNYFNSFYSSRMIQAGFQTQFIDADGTFVIGELARKYDMMLALNQHFYNRNDVDVENYAKKLEKQINAFDTPANRKILKDYDDRILCYFTGDETMPQNVPSMLAAHDAIKKIDPGRATFPYLNIHSWGNLPYLPIFLGDWYPIKYDGYGSRNPWSTAQIIKKTVIKAGDTPVWFMPQAFAYRDNNNYALPNAAESRLMLYLAVANGAKGIVFHALMNPSVPWRMKYYYAFSIYGNAGQRTAAWYAIRDCGKQLTAVGPCLFYTKPEWNFNGAKVECKTFTSSKKFYDGPAITLNALKQTNGTGRFLVVVNQDDKREQTGEIIFNVKQSGLALYDLKAMKKIGSPKTLNIKLLPGDAKFYFLGPDADAEKVFAEVCDNRYQREVVRYIIDAENAAKNGVNIKAASDLAKQAIKDYANKQNNVAYIVILQAQAELKKIVATTEFGQTMQKLEATRVELDKLDFMLRTHFDLIMPPTLEKKAPRYRIYKNTQNPEVQKLVDAIAKDFFDFWKLDREIRQGDFAEKRTQIEQLIKRIPQDIKAMSDYLKANEHKIKVENPYK